MRDFLIAFLCLLLCFIWGFNRGSTYVINNFDEKYYCKTVKELNVCAVYELKELENKK